MALPGGCLRGDCHRSSELALFWLSSRIPCIGLVLRHSPLCRCGQRNQHILVSLPSPAAPLSRAGCLNEHRYRRGIHHDRPFREYPSLGFPAYVMAAASALMTTPGSYRTARRTQSAHHGSRPPAQSLLRRHKSAQRVEVADTKACIMRLKSKLLGTLVAASSEKSAVFGAHSFVLKWRARKDSNL